ncbi:hypothetical protein EON83_10195 [bacterium]|nr:MAG: hypothetical protein EON83_10195 [bacterium]
MDNQLANFDFHEGSYLSLLTLVKRPEEEMAPEKYFLVKNVTVTNANTQVLSVELAYLVAVSG